MNEAMKRANSIKNGGRPVSAKEFKKWNDTESALQSQAEQYLQYFPNLAIIRIPDAAYRAIFANSHVSQNVKGMISVWLKGVPDLVLTKKAVGAYEFYSKKRGNEVFKNVNHCLCIEFKVGKNKLTQGQKHFAEKVNVLECRSFEHFKEVVDEFAK